MASPPASTFPRFWRYDVWSLYIPLVKERDEVRVEQWRGDTEGVLIFTGLFSATVATFLANSLSMLSPDSGDQTVELLSQVLLVLSNSTDASAGASSAIAATAAFEASTPSLLINTLWLASLFASLSSALGAILVQQWVRTYARDIRQENPRDPSRSGMVHSALALGLDRFRMDDIVNALIILLHVSVLLFCAGMLVLLYSMNVVVAGILTGFLGVGALVYTGFSVMPIFWHDTPYHTPLGGLFALLMNVVLQCIRLVVVPVFRSIFAWLRKRRISIDWFEWFDDILYDVWQSSLPLTRRAFLLNRMSNMHDIPPETRLVWYINAFKYVVERSFGLSKELNYWEAFCDGFGYDTACIQEAIAFAFDGQPSLNLMSHVGSLPSRIKSPEDGVLYFGRTALVLCALVYHTLKAFDDQRTVLYLDAKPDDYLSYRYAEDEACSIFDAYVRALIFARALKKRTWLSHPDCIELFERLRGYKTEASQLEALSDSDIQICLIANFVQLYEDILNWIDRPTGVQHVLATLEQTSWLPVVRVVYEAALSAAQADSVTALFAETANARCLREESVFTDLLSRLDVRDFRGPSTTLMEFSLVLPKYRPLLNVHPELAQMLYTLCATLWGAREKPPGWYMVSHHLPIDFFSRRARAEILYGPEADPFAPAFTGDDVPEVPEALAQDADIDHTETHAVLDFEVNWLGRIRYRISMTWPWIIRACRSSYTIVANILSARRAQSIIMVMEDEEIEV